MASGNRCHRPRFQNLSEMTTKMPFLGQFGGLGCPWRGPFAFKPTYMVTNHLIAVYVVLHPFSGHNNFFLSSKYGNISLALFAPPPPQSAALSKHMSPTDHRFSGFF